MRLQVIMNSGATAPSYYIMLVTEALAIIDTILPIAAVALEGSHNAHSLVQNIRNAPQQMQRLMNETHGLRQILGLPQMAFGQGNITTARLSSQMIKTWRCYRDHAKDSAVISVQYSTRSSQSMEQSRTTHRGI